MVQKVIKVGTSLAVVVPKDIREELSIKAGDKVSFDLDKKTRKLVIAIDKPIKVSKELMDWTNDIIEKYRPALEALKDK